VRSAADCSTRDSAIHPADGHRLRRCWPPVVRPKVSRTARGQRR
jgi:hypothetical protein